MGIAGLRPWVVVGLALGLGVACGPTIDRQAAPDAPIAFIRQKASEGILGLDEFRDALRLENEDDRKTLEARLRTSLALLNVPTGEIREVPDAGLGSIPLDWSGDGTRLLIGKVDRGRGTQLFSWNRLSGAWTLLSARNVGLGATLGDGPIRLAWSLPLELPKGTTHGLYVSTHEDPRKSELLARDATYPDVAPDGRTLVYASPAERLGSDGWIRVARLDGDEPESITRGSYPRYSRDGKWITFLRARGANTDVWLMRADGSARRKLTDTPYAEEFPSVSPDGRYVVYASARGEAAENQQLYMTRVSDRVEIQLTHGGQNGRPIW